MRVKYDDAKTLGLLLHTVERQIEAIKLPLMGRTDYDPNTLSKIRPRFDTLVEHVRAELGQHVKKGDPLVDLFSTELAAAKNDFQTAYVQWQHDLRLLTLREKLVKEKAISQQLFVDSQNDEQKSRLAFTTSKEKLLVFGVPEEQINGLLKNLGELGDYPLPQELHAVSDKARMTRLSPVDGIVIKRDAVTGNLYDNTDVLMVIAELNHLFVLVNVYEADQAKVAMGQEMEVRFRTSIGRFRPRSSTSPARFEDTVCYPDQGVDSQRRRQAQGRHAGQGHVDRSRRNPTDRHPAAGHGRHERQRIRVRPARARPILIDVSAVRARQLVVAEERDDHVVVKTGLKPGEHVALNGSSSSPSSRGSADGRDGDAAEMKPRVDRVPLHI